MGEFQLQMKIVPLFFTSICLVVGSSMGSNCTDSDLIMQCPSVCCCRSAMNTNELKVDCSGRNLTKIPNNFPNATTKITLDRNHIREIAPGSLSHLNSLTLLSLEDNRIESMPPGTLSISHLNKFSLAGNLLEVIPSNSIKNLTSLEVMRLEYNHIKTIESNAFNNPTLSGLFIGYNNLTHLSPGYFSGLPNLEQLGLTGNPLHTVEWRTFTHLPRLRVLEVCCVRNLTLFPDLTGTNNLQKIILDRCSISYVNSTLCSDVKHGMKSLEKLDLHSNAISVLPRLSGCSQIKNINFGTNKISTLDGQLFRGLSFALDLILKSNKIKRIPASAFMGLNALSYLDLNNNGIEFIHPDTFKPLKNLEELYLASNELTHIPSVGLQNILILDTSGNEHLEQIPPPSIMENILVIVTEHPYHCCILSPHSLDNYNYSSLASSLQGFKFNISFVSSSMSSYSEFLSSDYSFSYSGLGLVSGYQGYTSCTPQPGPFMPCSDLFGSWFLRIGVWIVFLLALLGNGIVILVIVFSRTKIDVSRFLICNLACADFAMGIYLGFLAVVDAATLGVFRQYGVHWQLSAGCSAAGFLAVFSSELSIYTLSVITLERFYAIKHALHLEKRLKLQQAFLYMCFGWLFALTIAMLPLLGVNSFYKYAVCLPFDIATKGALAYASGIMLLNGIAFVVIVMCYISIYCAIQGSLAWNCNDSRVALRMSLLVFTDFICWAPIACISLTSAFNLKHISLNAAKILTVFVLPVNSCANPFLYTILTKQFKKDCYMILHCFRSNSSHIHQIAAVITPGSTPVNGPRSIRSSLSNIGFPSCCKSSSTKSDDPITPKSHRRYLYHRETHTHCKKTKLQIQLPADHQDNKRSRNVLKRCGCFVPFWKNQRFSKSYENVSLKTLYDGNEARRRRHSVTGDAIYHTRVPTIIHSRECFMETFSRGQDPSGSGEREFGLTPDNYVLFPSNSQSENQFVLVDGEDSASTDNITSSSTKFTMVSVEVTKEYDSGQKESPKSRNRPTNLRVDCSPPHQQKVGKRSTTCPSPTYLSSPNFPSSGTDCSSPATVTEYWSPACSSSSLSPSFSPRCCPEILVTQVEMPSTDATDELGESIL